MKLKQLVGERFKERPADCAIDSHALMVRGAYMKYVGSGIYSSFTPLRRITRKIEQIIRQEMEVIDGQEVQFPVVLPATLWEESGRYESVGQELLRFSDRNGAKHVLGMTHEEAAVQLVREYGQTYQKYPFMIYQIQTKFRDEARPRGGLIRVREFTMKDAYSFHTSQEDLEGYYARCHKAYERIFARVGLPQVISVASDSGMMGGSISHEFMLLSPVGEDSVVTCTACDYRANLEAAPNLVENRREVMEEPLQLVHTPKVHTIEEVCNFVDKTPKQACKAVVYQQESDNAYVVLFLRGDLEVNEAKLKAILGTDIRPADITQDSKLVAGFIGPYGLEAPCKVLYDQSLKGANNLVCGGNRQDYHYTGLDLEREVGEVAYVDSAKAVSGGICSHCKGHSLAISRGIEVGNIFQLGTKYTQAMGMTYSDQGGQSQYPIMGCYGIGVGRLAASVCEACHDENGPIWPMAIAPWQVHICAVRADDPQVKAAADTLYVQLQEQGVEVMYDDRVVSAGVQFADADLLGVPLRIIVSPRNNKENCCELVSRDKTLAEKVELNQAVARVKQMIAGCMAK